MPGFYMDRPQQQQGSVLSSKDEFLNAKHTDAEPSHRVQEMGENQFQRQQRSGQRGRAKLKNTADDVLPLGV
jgi:hypothetical protein